jgi:hypothetical protein
MPTQHVDLVSLPSDQSAVPGYKVILSAWQNLTVAFDENKKLSEADLDLTLADVRGVSTVREQIFLQELQSNIATMSVDLRQAKLTGGLYKILMDRQGYKVSKDNGGLG